MLFYCFILMLFMQAMSWFRWVWNYIIFHCFILMLFMQDMSWFRGIKWNHNLLFHIDVVYASYVTIHGVEITIYFIVWYWCSLCKICHTSGGWSGIIFIVLYLCRSCKLCHNSGGWNGIIFIVLYWCCSCKLFHNSGGWNGIVFYRFILM